MLHENFHQNDESNHIEKIIKLKKKFSDALTTKDIKTISNAIKVCLYDAKEFDRNAKNSDQLLELVIQISKYFKSDFDFYQKMFDQNFLINNPKFYDVWNLTTDDLTKISLIRQLKDANCNTKPQPSKFLFTQLTTFLLSLSSDISSEEFRAALYLNKNIAQNIYDKTLINTFEENYKIYISQLFEKNTKENIFEDTINKTLLSVKPILPGATPTVNTKEARGFLDELVHKPAFDSSDESEDFFTHITRKADKDELHKSINILDIWESPKKTNNFDINKVTEQKNSNPYFAYKNNTPTIIEKNLPSILTSGYGTAQSENFSSERLIQSAHSQNLIKPVIVTPFEKYKMHFHNRNGREVENNTRSFVNEKHLPFAQPSEDTTRIDFYKLALSKLTSTPNVPKT